LPYEQYVGMMANISRARQQLAWAVAQGVAMANSDKPLDQSIFDAITESEVEAGELEFRTNAARAKPRR